MNKTLPHILGEGKYGYPTETYWHQDELKEIASQISHHSSREEDTCQEDCLPCLLGDDRKPHLSLHWFEIVTLIPNPTDDEDWIGDMIESCV